MLTLTVRPPTGFVGSFQSTAASGRVWRPPDGSSVPTRSRTSVLQKLVGADSARFPYVPRRRSGR